MNKSKVYRCYSVPQKRFLHDVKKIDYLDCLEDGKTGKTVWLFLRNVELDLALTEWSNNKPSLV